MLTRYRLLALDLDGTLLNDDNVISSITKERLAEAVKKGVMLAFATGRGYQRITHLMKDLQLEFPLVLLNGAEIWKAPDTLIERYFIKQPDIRALHDYAISTGAQFWAYSVDNLVKGEDWTDAMFQSSWMKFGMKHSDLDVVKSLRLQINTLPQIKQTSSTPYNIECALIGTSKSNGIKSICHHFNIEANEVMAIGDHMNDYDMIRWSGLGIAMGNADESIKIIADATTDTNHENGVAKAIEKYLL